MQLLDLTSETAPLTASSEMLLAILDQSPDCGFISISRDITELMLAREAADAVAAEMSHRLRNAYSMAGILMSAFAKGDAEKERFTSEMRERLGALAAAQTLQQDESASTRLPELLKAIVSPYATPTCTLRFDAIPDVELGQAEIDALAMVLGELCVNSAKHGALGANGKIVVSGHHEGSVLRITWSEQSDRAVQAFSRQNGQGMRLMRRVLAAREGEFEIQWQEKGLTAELRFARIA